MAMVSADVSAGDTILATDHNKIRADLITNHGHINTGGEGATHLQPAQITITPGGAVVALDVQQLQEQVAINIHSDAIGLLPGLTIAAKRGARIRQDISAGYGLEVLRSITEAGINPLIKFAEEDAAGTQPVLEIENVGSGENILYTHGLGKIIMLDPSAFADIDNPCTLHGTAGWSCVLTTNMSTELRFPNNVTITEVIVYAWCSQEAGVQTLTVALRGAGVGAITSYNMAECTVSWGNNEAASFKIDTDISISNATTNTFSRTYHIQVTAADAAIQFEGIRIRYTTLVP